MAVGSHCGRVPSSVAWTRPRRGHFWGGTGWHHPRRRGAARPPPPSRPVVSHDVPGPRHRLGAGLPPLSLVQRVGGGAAVAALARPMAVAPGGWRLGAGGRRTAAGGRGDKLWRAPRGCLRGWLLLRALIAAVMGTRSRCARGAAAECGVGLGGLVLLPGTGTAAVGVVRRAGGGNGCCGWNFVCGGGGSDGTWQQRLERLTQYTQRQVYITVYGHSRASSIMGLMSFSEDDCNQRMDTITSPSMAINRCGSPQSKWHLALRPHR